VANVYVHLVWPPLVAYEVRESLLDKLLGRGLFIPAVLGRALSHDSQRIIVPEDAPHTAAASLEELAGGPLAALIEEETVVRGRGGEGLPEGAAVTRDDQGRGGAALSMRALRRGKGGLRASPPLGRPRVIAE
jgi:hypothetical protein